MIKVKKNLYRFIRPCLFIAKLIRGCQELLEMELFYPQTDVDKVFLTAKHAKVCAKYAKINHW